jgi:hypothetical protein
MRSISLISGFSLVALLLSQFSCAPVKDYQKMYLNDSEMELAPRADEYSEMNFLLYREGASGGNGGRTGGGCGCN